MTSKLMSVDEQLAVLWWAAMPDSERVAWLKRAGSGEVRDAWLAFKGEQQRKELQREIDDDLATLR